MRTRYWIIIITVIALIAVALWLWRSDSSPVKTASARFTPKLKVASMNITDINSQRISILSRTVINNPLPVEVKTSRLDYEIFIDSLKVIKSSYDKPIVIKSSGDTEVELPMDILRKDMTAILKRFEDVKEDSADYTMKATLQVDVPIAGERNFDVNITKRLPAIRLPKLSAGKVDIDKLGLKQTSLDMSVLIENPNAFPIKMQDGHYSVTIDNKTPIKGNLEKIVNIPARGTERVSMQLDLKTGQVADAAWKFLFDKKNTTFKVDFNCKLISDNSFLTNSNLAMTAEGTLDELKNK